MIGNLSQSRHQCFQKSNEAKRPQIPHTGPKPLATFTTPKLSKTYKFITTKSHTENKHLDNQLEVSAEAPYLQALRFSTTKLKSLCSNSKQAHLINLTKKSFPVRPQFQAIDLKLQLRRCSLVNSDIYSSNLAIKQNV
jgi:hypothetical protein